MSDTTSNLPICIHCGTPRPADETNCPSCGQPWIDVQVAPPAPPAVPPVGAPVASTEPVPAMAAAAAASPTDADGLPMHDTGEFGMDEWTLPPEPPKSNKALWLIPIVLLLVVGAFWTWIAFFSDSPAATTTTTTTAATTTTSQVSTTTVPETTTTVAPTTTTLPYPPASTWPAVGDPISQADLGLAAAGIGPIDFGTPIAEAAGSLTSSLGEAELVGNDDACATGDVY